MKTTVEYLSDCEMKFIRVFEAPRSLVWAAHADIEKVAKWWGPQGFTITTHEINFKPGGLWLFTMHGPDGTDYSNRILFLEISEPNRMVYDHGSEEDPLLFHVVTQLFDLGEAGTRLEKTIKFRSKKERDEITTFALDGFSSSMLRLEELLAQ